MKLKKKIWEWPNGIVWKITHGLTAYSRKRKYKLFIKLMQPLSSTSIVDVGAGGGKERARNFLEAEYPHSGNITAVGIDPAELREMKKVFPQVRVVQADGRKLPFRNEEFDIVFSNAAIEHMGTADDQGKFIKECLRVGKKLFITTPARECPIDSHTLIPFAHWLPLNLRNRIYKWCGREYWAEEERLNLLSARAFRKMFSKDSGVRIYKQRLFGIPAVLVAVKK